MCVHIARLLTKMGGWARRCEHGPGFWYKTQHDYLNMHYTVGR